MTSPPLVFDRELVKRHLARAASSFAEHSALFDHVSAQIGERLGEIKRPFSQALDLSPFPFLDRQRIVASVSNHPGDEENLPFASQTFDLVVGNLGLHWVNDLPAALTSIRNALKSDGLFLASLIGGRSLFELRECLLDAEITINGGASPRFSPALDLQTAGNLMRRAGFHLPVADVDPVVLLYKDAYSLMHDLRGMGQTNAHTQRLKLFTRATIFEEADRLYKERYGTAEEFIPATFEIIYLHGWK